MIPFVHRDSSCGQLSSLVEEANTKNRETGISVVSAVLGCDLLSLRTDRSTRRGSSVRRGRDENRRQGDDFALRRVSIALVSRRRRAHSLLHRLRSRVPRLKLLVSTTQQ